MMTASPTKKRNLPIFRRVEEYPIPFQMTARDQEIIIWVYQLRFLTTNQIHRLLFEGKPTSRAWCEQRLKALFHHGFLCRIPYQTRRGLGKPSIIYSLDRKGRDFLAGYYDQPKSEIEWQRWESDSRTAFFFDHLVGINDVHINLHLAAQAAGHELVEWIDEKTIRGREDNEPIEDPKTKEKIKVIPDGWGQLLLANGKRFSFCLELDRGTHNTADFTRKVRGYLALWERGIYQKVYGTTALTVLTVVHTGDEARDQRRLAQVVAHTQEQAEWARKETFLDLFYATTLSAATPAAILTHPIWRVAGTAAVSPLLQ